MPRHERTGAARRDAGAEQVDENTSETWRAACDRAIATLARKRRPFTAEAVRDLVGDPPHHPNAMGSRFLAAARAGLITRVGYAPSARPTLHAHPIAVWQGVSDA